MKHTTAAKRLSILAIALGLIGCQALQPGLQEPPALNAEATFTEQILVDVDPFRAHAFERPMRRVQAVSVSGVMRLVADFTQVRHDPATNRTTVTMQLTNAGDALNYLKVQVAGDRKVVSPAYGFNATATKAGASQTVDLVFDNPGGGSFTVTLSLTGVMAKAGALSVTPGASAPAATPTPVATATPTPAPTATPTPVATPTATPTPVPTPTPTPTPAGSPTGVVATASSGYGTLQPYRVVDGDLATQWANDGYQQPEAHLTLDTGAVRPMSTLKVKMKPQSGTGYYRLEVSQDGVSYQTVSDNLKNTTWNLETKTLPAGTQGRYLRMHLFNDPAAPEARFTVYETQLDNLSGAPAPTPTPVPTPVPTSPVATKTLLDTYEQYSTGESPTAYVDPLDEGYSYSWLARVPWRISLVNASQQFLHENKSDQANLSFRRYRGTGLGTQNGLLPNKYYAEVDVTPMDSVTYWPTGDQGTQFYYLNPTNYVELLIKPNLFEVWVAKDAQPFQDRGWTRLYNTSINTAKGQTRKLAAEVDTTTQSLKVYLDGQLMTTLTEPMLTNQAHYFALRGTGNVVAHDNLKIEPR